jgi:hypothetical protein
MDKKTKWRRRKGLFRNDSKKKERKRGERERNMRIIVLYSRLDNNVDNEDKGLGEGGEGEIEKNGSRCAEEGKEGCKGNGTFRQDKGH